MDTVFSIGLEEFNHSTSTSWFLMAEFQSTPNANNYVKSYKFAIVDICYILEMLFIKLIEVYT